MYLEVCNVPAAFVLSDSCRKGCSVKQEPAEADVTLPHLGGHLVLSVGLSQSILVCPSPSHSVQFCTSLS